MSGAAAVQSQSDLELVGMGQLVVLRRGQMAKAVLGSCIGVAIYSRMFDCAAVAHIVLPSGDATGGLPGKFADQAIPHMLEQLTRQGAQPGQLKAKLAGGANMFASAGPIQIGQKNLSAVLEALGSYRIPVAGQHVGGQKGRRIEFDVATGQLRVNVAGNEVVVV